MTLPAFATERRRPPLSIDMSCHLGAQQQTRRTPQRLTNDGTDDERTDGRTDGHPAITQTLLRILCRQCH